MSRSFHTEGIILRTYRMGEIHKGVQFLSPELGLVDAVAFGAYSPKGKLRTITDPLCTGVLYLYRDPVKDRIKITDMDCRHCFPLIRQSVQRFFQASLYLETVLKTFGGEAPSVFDLLLDTLSHLETVAEKDLSPLLVQFLYRYLEGAGLSPNLSYCSTCGTERKRMEPFFFRSGYVEFFCKRCSLPEDREVPPGALSYLAHTRRLPLTAALSIGLDKASLGALKRCLLEFLLDLAQGSINTIRTASGYL
ncbi:MAG: DNA repair protein RecO [Spirochaetales bacterium]